MALGMVSATLACAAMMACATAHADETESTSRLQVLVPEGVTVQASIKIDALDNQRGGARRGAAATGVTDLRFALDLDRLAGLPDTRAQVSFLHHSLGGINQKAVDSLSGVTNLETAGRGLRIFRLWIERGWQEGRWSLRAGLIPADDEFSTLETAGTAMHPTNGPQSDFSGIRGASIYNHAALGLRLRNTFAERAAYWMAGVFDRPREDSNRISWREASFEREPGAIFKFEVGMTPLDAMADKDKPASEAFDKTALGLWTTTAKDPQLHGLGVALTQGSRSHGWYALREASLWRAPSGASSLAGWIRLSGALGNTYAIDRSLNAGLRARGLWPGRAEDITGALVAVQRLSAAWEQLIQSEGGRAARREDVLELHHQFAWRGGLSMTPVMQWITHPGGLAERRSSRVIGVRLALAI